MAKMLSDVPVAGATEPSAPTHARASSIPKPSDVSFQRRPSPCGGSGQANDHRVVVIRQSSRFRRNGEFYHLVLWCRPVDDHDADLDGILDDTELTPATGNAPSGVVRGSVNGSCALVYWQNVPQDAALAHMCDVLVREYERTRTPLQLYTPVVKFAAAFCSILRGVPDISWVDNYQTRVIHLDELCVSVAQKLMKIRKEHEVLTESWSHFTDHTISGHSAVPEQWIYSSDVVHIAADASYSRRTGGASAFVSSLGDYSALPARGKSVLCCELLAIRRAIEYARKIPGRVVIWSDSQAALNHIAHLDSSPAPKLRPIALTTLDSIKLLIDQRRISSKGPIIFRWIKAHTDTSSLQRILNDGADRLARHTMRNICDGEFTPALAGVCETIAADCMANLAALDPHTIQVPTTSHTPDASDDAHYHSEHDTDSCS